MQSYQSYSIMSKRAYAGVRTFYKNNAEAIGEKFGEYRYNAIKYCIESVDPTHINDMIWASRGVGRYRETIRIIKALRLPFSRDGDTFIPHQKMNARQKKRMKELSGTWNQIVLEAELYNESRNTTESAWNQQAFINRVVATLVQKGDATVLKAIESEYKKKVAAA